MTFTCIACKREIDPSGRHCPHCGEPITDFLRTYMVQLIDGKYRIIERLGRGGMGEVYKVLHMRLGAIRVIKTMRAHLMEDESLHERFLREAKLATRIQHQNVAMLHDFSQLPDGSLYMVWEYIEGTNLAAMVRREGRLKPRVAIDIAIQTLHGLEAIHEAGIIHRDISPENIMVFKEPSGSLRVKVIDLGIAKSEAVDGAVTSTGMFVGKWKYASPEHMGFLPEGLVIDGRADLFSFGIVLYEMLAGRPPYEATTPGQYFILHSKETPNPVTLHNLSFPEAPGLEKILARALEKDRGQRYPSAREFARALSTLLAKLVESDTEQTAVVRSGSAAGHPATEAPADRTAPIVWTEPAQASVSVPPQPPPPDPSRAVTTQALPAFPGRLAPTVSERSRSLEPTPAPRPKSSAARSLAIVSVVAFGLVLAGAGLWSVYKRLTDSTTQQVATTTTTPAATDVAAGGAAGDVTPPATRIAARPETTTTTIVPAPTTTVPAPTPVVPSPTVAPTQTPVVSPPMTVATPPAAAVPTTTTKAPAANGVPAGDRIPNAGPLGRRSNPLMSSDEWKVGFQRGIIRNYEDLYSGSPTDWAAVAPGERLSQYKVVLSKLANLSGYDNPKIHQSLQTDFQAALDKAAGAKGTVNAQIAVVWAINDPAQHPGIAVEMIFKDGQGRVLAKLHHRTEARSFDGAVDDMLEVLIDFVADHPVIKIK